MSDDVVKAGKEKVDYSELGTPGLTRFGGTVQEEFLTELQGLNGRKVYDQMRKNDPVVAAMLRAIGWILQSVKWNVEPDTKAEGEPADFVEECRDSMEHTWSEFLSEAATVLPFGFSLFEIVPVRRKDGRIGWKRFGFRAQDTVSEWEFDPNGYATAAFQVAPPEYKRVRLPLSKCLLLRMSTEKANPEGESILRAAYRSFYYVQNIQEIEGIGLERDLAGMPTVYLGNDCSKTGANSDLALMKEIARNVRRDEQECIVIPKPKMGTDGNGVLFELLSSGGKREFDTGAIIGRYEQRMAMSVLAQWLMLGMDSQGSYALSTDQSDFFRLGIDGTIRTIGEQFTKQAIQPLLRLNPGIGNTKDTKTQRREDGYSEEPKVRMVGRLPVSPDYSKFAAAVNQLVQAQVLDPSDERLRGAVADALGLPQPMIEVDGELETESTNPHEQTLIEPTEKPKEPLGNPHDLNGNTMPAVEKGGPGSGNWGHAGRPGIGVGGSMPGSGIMAAGVSSADIEHWPRTSVATTSAEGVVEMAELGAETFALRDEAGKIQAVADIERTKYPDGLMVGNLASNVRGGGTKMMIHLCKEAAKDKRGVFLYAVPEARGFYSKIGMHINPDNGIATFSPEEAAQFGRTVISKGEMLTFTEMAQAEPDQGVFSQRRATDVAKADPWLSATDAYQRALGSEYEDWAGKLSRDLADADPEDYDDIVKLALAALALKLKARGRKDLADAFQTGARGAVSPAGWAKLADLERQNETSIETSLVPAVASVDWRQVIVGGAAAILSALLGKAGLVGQYAGVYWRALNEGAGERVPELGNPPVRWVLDDLASHCSLCPSFAREYESWDDMMAQCNGAPGSGQTPCGGNCRCTLEYWDGKEWQRF